MPTVHVRITDSATGQPIPVRIHIAACWKYCAPLGRLARFSTLPGVAVGGNVYISDDWPWSYVDGACEVDLPPGHTTILGWAGYDYLPLAVQLNLAVGQLAIRLIMERRPQGRPDDWISADSRCHALTPHAALLEAAAEGLHFVNLLAQETEAVGDQPSALPNLLAFSGQRPALERPGHAVVVNTLNVHPVLGTLALLDSHRPIYPLRFGGPGRADDWSLVDWSDQCHRKRGLVVWPDLPRMTAENPQGEALAACLLGKVDAFEVCRLDRDWTDYYRLLSCGCRLALVGGSGKDSNAIVLGAARTEAHVTPGSQLDYAAWVEAVRAGRTFVTNGPLLFLNVNEAEPGAVLTVAETVPVTVRVAAHETFSGGLIEVIANGEVVAAGPGPSLEAVVQVDRGGWLAARFCEGTWRAHTSPITLMVEGKTPQPAPEDVSVISDLLTRTFDWIEQEARCSDGHRQRLAGGIRAAQRAGLR